MKLHSYDSCTNAIDKSGPVDVKLFSSYVRIGYSESADL